MKKISIIFFFNFFMAWIHYPECLSKIINCSFHGKKAYQNKTKKEIKKEKRYFFYEETVGFLITFFLQIRKIPVLSPFFLRQYWQRKRKKVCLQAMKKFKIHAEKDFILQHLKKKLQIIFAIWTNWSFWSGKIFHYILF